MQRDLIIPACTHRSVGVMVFDPSMRLVLLQQRAKPPYGMACPAGHVDPGETYEEAARRELLEETGLHAMTLTPVFEGGMYFPCRRPGGAFHAWMVYHAVAEGPLIPAHEEVRAQGWYGVQALRELVSFTQACAGRTDWPHMQLEAVWYSLIVEEGLLFPFVSDIPQEDGQ